MAKSISHFICQACGAVHTKWSGKCDDCGAWNTIAEEKSATEATPKGLSAGKGKKIEWEPLNASF
jgi:DNA repair protein RadA/Sms